MAPLYEGVCPGGVNTVRLPLQVVVVVVHNMHAMDGHLIPDINYVWQFQEGSTLTKPPLPIEVPHIHPPPPHLRVGMYTGQ